MKEDCMVITTDDVMNYYVENTNLLYNYNNMIYSYIFKEEFGKGSIERIIINSDIEIWLMDYCFKSDIIMLYDMPEDYFEIACCTYGVMEHYERNMNKTISFSTSKISVFAKKNASGHVKYLKNTPYKGVAIITNKQYVSKKLNGYCEDNIYWWHNRSKEWLNQLYMGRPTTLKELNIINDIVHCELSHPLRLMYLEAKAGEFIALKFNDLNRGIQKNEVVCLSDYDMQRINMTKTILYEHMINPPSITELAKTVGLNSTKLKKGFKLVYNNTIFGFLRDIRLERAKILLFNEDMTIADIANQVGYSNPSKFSKAFKNKYGLNPKEVRKR